MALSHRSQLYQSIRLNLSTQKKVSTSIQQTFVNKLGPKFTTWLCVMVKTYSPKSTALGVATSAFLTKYGASVRGRNGLARGGTGLSETTRWRVDNEVITVQQKRQRDIMKMETVIHSFDNLHRHRGLYKLKPGKSNMILLDWTVFCFTRLPKLITIPRFQVPDGVDFRKSVPKSLLFGPSAASFLARLQEEAHTLLGRIRDSNFFPWTLVSTNYHIDRPRSLAKDSNGEEVVSHTNKPGQPPSTRVQFASHAGASLGETEPTTATNANSNSHVGIEANAKTLLASLGKTAAVGKPIFYDVHVSDIAIWLPLLLAQFSASNPCPLLFSSLILYWDEFHWIKVRLNQNRIFFASLLLCISIGLSSRDDIFYL